MVSQMRGKREGLDGFWRFVLVLLALGIGIAPACRSSVRERCQQWRRGPKKADNNSRLLYSTFPSAWNSARLCSRLVTASILLGREQMVSVGFT